MKYSLTFAALAGAIVASAQSTTPDACAAKCNDDYNHCVTAPGANRSFCGSEYAGCLGYSPFQNGSTAVPTTCAPASTTATAAPSAATPDACAAKCNDDYNHCVTAPGANRSFCGSEYAGCLGYSPFQNGSTAVPTTCAPASTTATAAPSAATPDACAAKCNDDYNHCVTAPGANRSFCGSEYAGCLGYSPFQNGSTAVPTTCAATTSASTTAPAATGSSTSVAAPPTATPDACAAKCNDDYNHCVTAPGANRSFCGSEYAGCLGFSPFQNGNTAIPTACSSTSGAPSSTGTPAGTPPTDGSGAPTVAPTAAPTVSASGAPTLVSSVVSGAAPSTTGASGNGTAPVINGAGVAKPAMAMLAIGALALF